MARPLRAARPDVVVHLAAQTSVGESFHDPGQSCRVNVDGTLALARILMDQLPSALLVHASSAEVYGLSFQSGHPLNEDAPMVPANPYAAARTAIDLALGEMTLRGLRLVRPRLFNLVGAGQSDAFVLPSFCRQFAWAEQDRWPAVIRVGALDRWRDFVEVRDGCDALCAAIRHAETLPPGIAINIASRVSRRVGCRTDDRRPGQSTKLVTLVTGAWLGGNFGSYPRRLAGAGKRILKRPAYHDDKDKIP